MARLQGILSLGWLTVSGAHPLEHIEAAIAGGFNAVGLRLMPPAPGDPMIPVVGDEPLICEVRQRLADSGVTVLDVETFWIGPCLDIPELQAVMDAARRLGARNLLTMGNDADESRLTANFARLCEEALQFDLDVGMEFAAYTHMPTLEAAHRLVCAAAQPNGKILVDSLHLARSGGTPEQISTLEPARVAYCQLGDARGPRPSNDQALRSEARGGRYFPGEGELPLAQLIGALPSGTPLVVEAPCTRYSGLPAIERGRLAGRATHRFLELLAEEKRTP